jgi:L-fucose mutarotase
MVKYEITHPELLQALAESGHGSRILVADSNYPVTTKANPNARIVFLNFTAGTIGGVEIIRALANAIPVESATYMHPEDKSMPEIVKEYTTLLPKDTPVEGIGRFEFYDLASEVDTALVIASGEGRIYANLLLTVGVRK